MTKIEELKSQRQVASDIHVNTVEVYRKTKERGDTAGQLQAKRQYEAAYLEVLRLEAALAKEEYEAYLWRNQEAKP